MKNPDKKYCNSITEYSRFVTREVFIGDIPLGWRNPIRIQSMTTTNTMDTSATVEQTIRMVETGCEYVRITAPSIKDAENLANIKSELNKRGYSVPLIADIHFTPNAAIAAAKIVEKVRINPGNYVDKKKFQKLEYTDTEYEAEIDKIREKFLPLVKVCKEYNTAMRIGTNHGSLSDRIMSRYGDTPLGMVESALEFVRICGDENYHDIVLSMKASNTKVMVEAYRLLVNKMIQNKMNYPIHLGVTEAGGGEDGRIKSAVGIGALLEDGIGDTIRVSLTEEPENESPVAIRLADRYKTRLNHKTILPVADLPYDPFNYKKRESFEVTGIGGGNLPVVVADFSKSGIADQSDLKAIGYNYSEELDKWNINDTASDLIYLGDHVTSFEMPASLKIVYNINSWIELKDRSGAYPLFNVEEFAITQTSAELNFVKLNIEDFEKSFLNKIIEKRNFVFVLNTDNSHGMAEQRRVLVELENSGIKNPVIIKRSYNLVSDEEFRLYSSTDLGSLLVDGLGDGVWCETTDDISHEFVNRTLFGILQATRSRISKTEYIACPSCGRTLFDLVEVTGKIRKRTEHLKGVKIGIMGCIVNGPGEMADADYGYVGSGIGKITLYRGKDIVKRNLKSEIAVEELIELIKEDGNWIEPDQR
ncbi:(E)-4-hydroxy-3-methylbut-2-enyl-diphosphate synthase [Bacteroidota bacterium]